MIPKIIHYCWFGQGKMNELHKQCIESWKEILYDYEIMIWNEESFDIDSCIYTKEAYEAKKFAYVSDYVRLYALNKYGGIYLDTDVRVLKTFNPFLNFKGFISYEDDKKKIPATCVIGSCKNNELIKVFLDYYKDKSFINEYGGYDLIPNTVIFSKILRKQSKNYLDENIYIFPSTYFSPELHDGKPLVTNNTYSIHYFDGSWIKNKGAIELEMDMQLNKYIKLFGKRIGGFMYRNIQRIKKLGVIGWIQFLKNRKI